MTNLHKKLNNTTKLAIFSSSLLAAASAVYLYSPVFKSSAEERAVDVTVNVNPIVSLSLDKSALNFNITPTSAGVFDSGSIIATVDTNSTGGYELYFSSEDSGTALTSLVSESTIASDFNSAVTSSTMSANKWGYSLDATNFNKIPALADQAKIKDLDHVPTSAEKDTTVTIGTKIDSSLPSGAYSKKVVFSAIAHPSPILTLHSITTMQQMTAAICTETTTPLASAMRFDTDGTHNGDNTYVPRVKLQDTRDGNYYLVSKLADGNCWMSQNLALDLTAGGSFTRTATDLNNKSSWTSQNATQTVKDIIWGENNSVAAVIDHSYHSASDEAYYQGGITKSSTPTANTDEYLWEKAGNYYNWYAATAGSGTYEMDDGDAMDSICPKGWQLPEYSGNKSYNTLLTTYNATPTTVLSAPINFTRNGFYRFYSGKITGQEETIYYWSKRAHYESASQVFIGDEINYINGDKGHGRAVRCVAR